MKTISNSQFQISNSQFQIPNFKFQISNFIFLILYDLCLSQDIHFSQFNKSPLNLNPALTGAMESEIRGVINYRNQWKGITTPYKTMSLSADMTLLGDKVGEDWIGTGFVIVNDKAGSGELSTLRIMLSGAYFKWLDRQNYLSWGLQTGIVQRKIDISKLTFENQWTGTYVDPNIDPKEPISKSSYTHLDIKTGLLWSYKPHDKLNISSGIALFHLLNPQKSFFDKGQSTTNKDGRVGLLHSNAIIGITKELDLLPQVLYMYQKQASELSLGTYLGYSFIKNNQKTVVLYIGGLYRYNDAAIVLTGLQFESWTLEISYDINISPLSKVSNGRGGSEFSLIYQYPLPSNTKRKPIPCPRFE